MVWITLMLIMSACSCVVLGQRHLFSEAIAELNLSSDEYFNAAIGAKVQVSPPQETIYCNEGVHCLLPWWTSSEGSIPVPQTTELKSVCNGLSITCDRRCPSVQYSTPAPQRVSFDRVRCNKDGSSNLILAKKMRYPISVQTADPCAPSLNFVNGFSRTAGFHFLIALDINEMRAHNDSHLLLLEGKLVSSTGRANPAQSADVTFFWTLEREIDNSYDLTLYMINSAQFALAPRQMYKSVKPYRSATAQISMFIRHIHNPGGSTCFYVDGLKAACLTSSQSESRSIQFLSLNSANNFNLNTVSGSILDIALYEMGQPSAVISESEIQNLFTGISTANSTKDSTCLCQSVQYPFMRRSDWKAFSEYPSSYSEYCYADESDLSATAFRYTIDQHGLANAFDGIETSSWLTTMGITNLTISLSFPHKIKIEALALSLSTLPEYVEMYDSSRNFIASIQFTCKNEDIRCVTWSYLTEGVDRSQNEVPLLKWPLANDVITDEIILYMEGTQDRKSKVLLINDILVIATCYCAGNATCTTDSLVSPMDASINHRCECPQNITGVNCDLCSTGLYTTVPTGKVDDPSSCTDCGCNALGTCFIVNSTLCMNLQPDSCDGSGRCLCRSGSSTHYDDRNPKCMAEVDSIYPSYGPESGGTRLTFSGKYLAGYSNVKLSSNRSDIPTMLQASTSRVNDGGIEELVMLTPAVKSHFEQFTVQLVGVASPHFIFTYRPNPSVTYVQQRDISVKGGFKVIVKGDNLDSSVNPVMLTYLFCAKSGALHDAIVSTCEGNRTMMTCMTADLAESLSTMRCIVTKRLRRAAPITVSRDSDNDYSGIYADFGFQFDGFSKYRLLNRTVKTSIYDDPAVFNLTEVEVTPLAETLSIKGERLTKCCDISDYSVLIGEEPCHITFLFKDKIICILPDSWKLSGADVHRNVTVTLGEREPIMVGTIIKTIPDNIWDDKKFVLTIAVSCTLTFVLAMVAATVICCVYHKRFFTGQTNIKNGVQEENKAQKPDEIEQEEADENNGDNQPQPENYIKEAQPDEDEIQYVIATELSLDLDDVEVCDEPQGQVYYVSQESTNSYNNKGYYEIEV